MSRDQSLTPLNVDVIDDPPLRREAESFTDPSTYDPNARIAIDFGSYNIRAGYTNQNTPSYIFPTRLTKHRDRKLQKTFTFIGNDTLLDQTIRSQSKSPFDGTLLTNWDYVEDMLEYTFHHLGVSGNNGVSNPLIINERLACLQSQRNSWYQLLFETFDLPEVSFGIDSLFSFYGNSTKEDGLVINCGNEETDVIPIVGGRGILSECKRINWGGSQSTNFLSSLLTLKYPYFPAKLSTLQYTQMYEDYCYTSPDYANEISRYLNLDELEQNNIVLETPFTEVLQPKKTEEELRIQAEKRKETGKRLQEQARQKRVERLVQKTEEYEYFSRVRDQLVDQPKKTILSVLQNAGFEDEQDFKKYLSNLEKSLKKAQATHDGDADDTENADDSPENKFDLVDVPDEELNDEQLKEKRKQKFLKGSFDARRKAKVEKERLAKEHEEAKIRDQQWRESDLSGWIKSKRAKLAVLVKRRKDKIRMKNEMKDRKSQVAQNRMKNLANLAEDSPRSGSKRSRGQATIDNDPNDTFGANDEDWLVYQDITKNPEEFEEALEEEYKDIVELEGMLLEYDPTFTEEDTLDAQYDWRNSTLHLFLRGPRPHDSEDVHQQHQLHLNTERIRVPEILFEPSIAGQDQAGIAELCETILLKKFGSKPGNLSAASSRMVNNVWITGGNARIPGIKNRIVKEFTEFLPAGTPLSVHMSEDPSLDAWKGMAKLANNETDYKNTAVTRKEYEEYGPDYIKEHKLGNTGYFEDVN
ncbi:actin-related protein ARP5 KNAG_0I01860 [Huiozyma naganishii CBS 8797]|uniref:Actin-related protein 5 n=1 Tax=Huiozyma naganishii (strain ATCC MYA-139 / BCRC 22969 / CBS 8797 / KCTC 17520 / NBRC 10181 / NCYC 3082 / Yp74L-3) TaxID=1071383 RepID=J7SA97_HUIN7|nr:hypothetical protein KNAG_0I01860 [Kazachstania naganishii CBS 8797]CCK71971.1 hypothetical protein KNAG_0I01860 [Kazachstania naganishii CBS 8797]